MQTHNITAHSANKTRKRVGRGGGRGKTSGRGMKGQNARTGNSKRPEMRDVIKKIPKLANLVKNCRSKGVLQNKHHSWDTLYNAYIFSFVILYQPFLFLFQPLHAWSRSACYLWLLQQRGSCRLPRIWQDAGDQLEPCLNPPTDMSKSHRNKGQCSNE